jgi:hypothetical protein
MHVGLDPLVSAGGMGDMLTTKDQPPQSRPAIQGHTAAAHDRVESEGLYVPFDRPSVHEDKVLMSQKALEPLGFQIISEGSEEPFRHLQPVDAVCFF